MGFHGRAIQLRVCNRDTIADCILRLFVNDILSAFYMRGKNYDHAPLCHSGTTHTQHM